MTFASPSPQFAKAAKRLAHHIRNCRRCRQATDNSTCHTGTHLYRQMTRLKAAQK
jgi:recombinational DNA repair protein RecR